MAVGETIRELLSGIPVGSLNINLKDNRLTLSSRHSQIWRNVAEDITKSLGDVGIKYVLIKVLCVPNAYLEDIDLLIENEDEISQVLDILSKKDYSLYRDRYSLNVFKITAISHQKGVQVDIYPESTWFNMRYAPKFFITSNRIKRRIWGIEAYLPNPTLDFYIVATHSYNHGFISLAEAAHIVRLTLENHLDWDLLRNLSDAFKLNHALLPFLRIVQLAISNDEISNKINILINEMAQKDTISRVYLRWFERTSPNGFPLRLPLTLRILSACRRLFRPSLKSYTIICDELIGYTLALIFRGDRRAFVS